MVVVKGNSWKEKHGFIKGAVLIYRRKHCQSIYIYRSNYSGIDIDTMLEVLCCVYTKYREPTTKDICGNPTPGFKYTANFIFGFGLYTNVYIVVFSEFIFIGSLLYMLNLLFIYINCKMVDMNQVFKVNWWMCHYGSESPKRHMALTNNPYAEALNRGKLTKQDRERCTKKTVIKYISKSGRPSYKGTSQLKSTQFLLYIFEITVGWVFRVPQVYVYMESIQNMLCNQLYIYIYFCTLHRSIHLYFMTPLYRKNWIYWFPHILLQLLLIKYSQFVHPKLISQFGFPNSLGDASNQDRVLGRG